MSCLGKRFYVLTGGHSIQYASASTDGMMAAAALAAGTPWKRAPIRTQARGPIGQGPTPC